MHFKFIVRLAIVKSQRFEIVRQFLLACNSGCGWAFYFLSSSVHIFIDLIVMWFTRDRIEYLMGLSQSVVMLCQCVCNEFYCPRFFLHRWQKKFAARVRHTFIFNLRHLHAHTERQRHTHHES